MTGATPRAACPTRCSRASLATAAPIRSRARAVGRDLGGHAKAIGSAALSAAKAEATESAKAMPKTAGEAKTHAGRVGSAAVGAAKAAAKQAAKDLIAKHFGPLGGDGIQRPLTLHPHSRWARSI